MASKKIIAICQSGGEFVTNNEDGFLTYTGGEAYALDIDDQTVLADFKKEIAENFQCGVEGMTIKYFLPGNKKTLITISKDKDLKRMINFVKDSDQVEIFIIYDEAVVKNEPNVSASRSTTASEAALTPATPVDVDMIQCDDLLGADAAIDTTPLCVYPDENKEKHRRAATQWENTITGVGQRFNSFAEFREALHKYSIAHGFAYRYKKNDSRRVTAKCKVEGCSWCIYASRLPTTQLICIKKMNEKHTCDGAAVKAAYRSTRGWMGSIIKEKLKVAPNYKPKDIAKDIEREYGIQLNYSQARRAKEKAREQLQGSFKEAYSQLPLFCEKIRETNPGSVAIIATKEDSSFHRLFIAFHASISGFQQVCRPLIFLDSTLLYAKYQGTLLAAVGVDGNDGVFPVAFAVVDEETSDNWHWFLSELKSAVYTASCPITFISDFQRGIRESLHNVFGEECYHGFCLRYLAEKLNNDLKGQFSHEARRLMIQDLYAAACAIKLESFERCVENIKAISPEVYNWVTRSEPEHWANAFFGWTRYGHLTSNFGQLFYDWVAEVNELPITQMVDVLRGKIMELIYTRRVESSQWVTTLTPLMEQKLQSETSRARSLHILSSHGSTFEVHGESIEVVDIEQWDCSCKEWQLNGLPCCHGIAALEYLGRSPYDYCSRYFSTESYRVTYAESINPIPHLERPIKGEPDMEHTVIVVTPPPTKRLPGRPKMKKADTFDIVKRQMQCSKCKGLGHNKKTCGKVNNIDESDPLHLTGLVTGELETAGSMELESSCPM
ncbi:uncharacterized protein LOC132030584 [Lycium ferocissimum]|uniref:uncharacterized protein LOC132030584 n=1 Tax=Lycium ferocissimum TaxID=112874 RepID=UPI002814F076|nr:uncharacterized protein LOC132030584 [Lycium ferocissimum]XP_059276263.1 uncharacterized protein LOC132030584 [Lycium ferocissimum]XP_059276264.1 uncharacterized protein LOC132030584 [Lycium ferocissimum]